ncbi:MAG: acyl-CoA synthetase [Thermodesulfobacteriota bacterium]|nr:acyl-CoA synthetase [Thermodesulfobacteriota bacterium]
MLLIARAESFRERTAVISAGGEFSYGRLLEASGRVAASLLDGADDLSQARVAFLVRPGFGYAAALWGVWRAGGVAVPLAAQHPLPELEYSVDDAGADIILGSKDFDDRLSPLASDGRRLVSLDQALLEPETPLPHVEVHRSAMILYTSGTTGKPKGVVMTHQQIQSQITTLVSAWGWTQKDHILHVLPLHHTHGIVNVLLCALWSGAVCEMLPKFEAEAVWERFLQSPLTLFMAVPTIYVKLISAWESFPPARRAEMSAAASRMRLMVSGSAALPVSVLEKWKAVTGHVLLERYGMTEIGMALSNPLHGERVPGCVGAPLPGVDVRLVDKNGSLVQPGVQGEIQVRSPGVFKEYWHRPEVTAASFKDDWFRTGDVAVVEDGVYRLLGRKSVDIIKSGGYKISALEIEEVLLTHPGIEECSVVGLPDLEWGRRVGAALVLKKGAALSLSSLRDWAKERLATYKVPTRMLTLGDLPRNPMGKVTKPEVIKMFADRRIGEK